jgi:hypothetical protein
MMVVGKKQVLIIVILLAVIVAAGLYGLWQSGLLGQRLPPWVAAAPIEKIDTESLEVITKSYAEWQKLGPRNGRFKNPNTGKYTMATVVPCIICRAKIPRPDLPEHRPNESPETRAKLHDKERAIWQSYKCPKCGGSPG